MVDRRLTFTPVQRSFITCNFHSETGFNTCGHMCMSNSPEEFGVKPTNGVVPLVPNCNAFLTSKQIRERYFEQNRVCINTWGISF